MAHSTSRLTPSVCSTKASYSEACVYKRAQLILPLSDSMP